MFDFDVVSGPASPTRMPAPCRHFSNRPPVGDGTNRSAQPTASELGRTRSGNRSPGNWRVSEGRSMQKRRGR